MKGLYKAAVAGCAILSLAPAASLAEVEVPVVSSLREASQYARSSDVPILLAFTANYCEYCELLEENFLEPMLLSGEYSDRIIIRKLVIDSGIALEDFKGRFSLAGDLAERYHIMLTPTILFLDANGNELAQRMIGINTLEMFGGYLDECIETALFRTRNPEKPVKQSGCLLSKP